MAARFRVGLAPDLLDAAGNPTFGAENFAVLDGAPEIERAWLPERHREIPPALALEYDALYLTQARVTRASVARAAEGRLKVIARHGVGYDSVDVAAMTEAGVIVTNTPFAIRRPVATIAMTFVLALAGHLFTKDRLTRSRPLGRAHELHGHRAHRPHARHRGRRRDREGAHPARARVRSAGGGRRSVRSRRPISRGWVRRSCRSTR